MQSFTAPMLSRNPELHFVFARMGMAEEQGLGLGSLRDRAKELELPLPKYTWDAPYIVLQLYRTRESATRELKDDIVRRLNTDEKATWQFAVSRGTVTSAEVMKHLGFDERKAQRMLRKLLDEKLLRRIGKGPATRYEVLRR
jgi:ATP-dependent DNA helicase RecG